MLPTELLMFKVKAGIVEPRLLKPNPTHTALIARLIELFETSVGKRRFELSEELKTLEEGRRDYRVVRGLAHILAGDHSTFATGGVLSPPLVRARIFELSQAHPPARFRRQDLLEQVGRSLGADPQEVADALYADLPDQQTLVSFEAPDPQILLDRYNLAQAQGLLYRAYSLIITARRNEPARYRQLISYVKFFGLMVTVEGDSDYGFTLTLDGPTSLFGGTTRYGLSLAKFLPALLHVTEWDLSAALKPRKDLAWTDPTDTEWSFQLTSEDGYVSHYPPPKEFDSALESGFSDRFAKLKSPWKLEREVDLVPIPGGVIIPDFRLLHEDGRSVLLEIVGYWRPDYLTKKFDRLKKSGRMDIIVAVSERLNLEKAGIKLDAFGEQVISFKGVLDPKRVLELAEILAVQPTERERKKRSKQKVT
ncbi:DUF790 family protein (plasmid) [Deinococcus psychrotolerans]|uniref:DUF790 family protein n=1 Tax=Deinococcus psychrotolerans TaxID=2489213 RepID=A0A3G8YUF3_9DEIO|nr:DUF790 family protein [Deinococcus psychrotolerans]AZI45241.1 DUF790 family protein [Deinococcus psychrotolerans]